MVGELHGDVLFDCRHVALGKPGLEAGRQDDRWLPQRANGARAGLDLEQDQNGVLVNPDGIWQPHHAVWAAVSRQSARQRGRDKLHVRQVCVVLPLADGIGQIVRNVGEPAEGEWTLMLRNRFEHRRRHRLPGNHEFVAAPEV